MSLLRRRMMMARKPSGGETIFPVSLIEGDNGEIGVKLFEYIIENTDEYISFYEFKDNEDVYIHGVRISDAFTVSDGMIALNSMEFPPNILVVYLLNTGVLTIVYD